MRVAQIVVLGVALTAGGAAAMYVGAASRQHAEPPKTVVVQPKTTEVLIAKANLSRAHVIGEQDIGWQTWPVAAANQTLIKKTERPDAIHQFLGAMVRVPVASGEPIHEAAVVFAKSGGFMAAVVKPGMRAVTMNTDSAAEDSILPDDRIDVILTPNQKAPGEDFHSGTILSDVRVLAVSPKSVTMELTPRQAETFAASRAAGTLSLTLRSFADNSPDHSDDNDRPSSINVVRYGVRTSASIGRSWW